MSIIWGILKHGGTAVTQQELHDLSAHTVHHASGRPSLEMLRNVGFGFQLNETHVRSRFDQQVLRDSQGNCLAFDGRLDNWSELAGELDLDKESSSDAFVVLNSFQRWGEMCFARLSGDWAISLWHASSNCLFLARDHAGTRTLYVEQRDHQVRWHSYLDALVTGKRNLRYSEDYSAAYLSCLPIGDRTPFQSIMSVPAGHYLAITDTSVRQKAHWTPVVLKTTLYKQSSEYDQHFTALFQQAVVRRTGPGAPILAQLSGGMDSTAIVCMSDYLRRSTSPDAALLDTLSYFDNSDPSLNERAYFTITEAYRGKSGIHLNTSVSQRTFDPPIWEDGGYPTPGFDGFSVGQERRLFDLIWKPGYRVMLSGCGGDEVLGGVPTPFPELAAHFFAGHLSKFVRQSVAWCLVDRSPFYRLGLDTFRFTAKLYERHSVAPEQVAPWLSRSAAVTASQIVEEKFAETRRWGVSPDRLDNAQTWWLTLETLPHLQPEHLFRMEYRYPMLDRELVTFLFSVPRGELLKPGRRRALMRRSLRGIVPVEILERRRKAFQSAAPLRALQGASSALDGLFSDSLLMQAGLIDDKQVKRSLVNCLKGDTTWMRAMFRTIAYELWLRARESEGHGRFPFQRTA